MFVKLYLPKSFELAKASPRENCYLSSPKTTISRWLILNIDLGNGASIPPCSHVTALLAKNTSNNRIEAPSMEILRMKMLRCFGIHVLVNILNLEISCCCLPDYDNGNILKFVSHVQHDYFSSFDQSDYFFLASSLSLPSSLL